MQEIARDVYEAMQAAPGVQAVEWEEVPTGIPTARISRSHWMKDRAWQEKNPEGRRVAIWYPRGGRVDLIRHSGPGYIEHPGGEEVEYPDLDQPTARAVHTDPGPAVTVKLEWVG